MFFKQLATRDASLSYFFGCGGQGKAVAVDVVEGDEQWFIDEAARAQVTITHVIDTHVHADHVSGGRELAQRTGAAYCLHENARTRATSCISTSSPCATSRSSPLAKCWCACCTRPATPWTAPVCW